MNKKCSRCKVDKSKDSFYKDRRRKDGLQSQCKECHLHCVRTWQGNNKDKVFNYEVKYQKNNKDKVKKWQLNTNMKEGIGVYEATYPSGKYIGSGQIAHRRRDHLCGSANIPCALGEKATSFKVIYICEDRATAYDIEYKLIENIGLSNLLNSRGRVVS